jgi:molecular chaperone DnaK
VAEVEESLKSDDTDRIRKSTDALQAKFAQLAAAAQQATGAQAGAAPGADDETSSEPKRAKGDVVDAEFEEVGDSRS